MWYELALAVRTCQLVVATFADSNDGLITPCKMKDRAVPAAQADPDAHHSSNVTM